MPKKWLKKVRYQGENRVYTVSLDERAQWSCSCPGWIFQRGSRTECRHILDVSALVDQLAGKVVQEVSVYVGEGTATSLAFRWRPRSRWEVDKLLGQPLGGCVVRNWYLTGPISVYGTSKLAGEPPGAEDDRGGPLVAKTLLVELDVDGCTRANLLLWKEDGEDGILGADIFTGDLPSEAKRLLPNLAVDPF